MTRTELALDTVVTITIYQGGSEEVLNEAFEIVNDYDDRFNAFDPESEIGSIGEEPTTLSNEAKSLLEENMKMYQLTGGRFSPTLGSLISLWNIQEPEIREAPGETEIEEALSHTHIENLILDNSSGVVYTTDPSLKVNLGASLKGYLADNLKTFLVDKGVTSAIINLGGNILLIGDHNGEDFNIGIDYPDSSEGEPLAVLKLKNKSIVTSGGYQRYFTDSSGVVYHHLLDPTTGYPARSGLREVVVISDDSLTGDMLSTALYVMGREAAIEFLKKSGFSEKVEVIFVTDDNTVYVPESLKESFSLEPEYVDQFNVNYYKL